MDMELIHRLEIAFVHRSEDGVCDVPPDNLGNPLRDPLRGADYCNAEDVLPIGFVLRVAVVSNLWFDGAGVGAGVFGGRSQRRKHVSVSPLFFFLFLSSPLWCWAFVVFGCGGVCTLLVTLRLIWWGLQPLLHQLF